MTPGGVNEEGQEVRRLHSTGEVRESGWREGSRKGENVSRENGVPHPEAASAASRRGSCGITLSSQLARVAARARSQPKECFSNLMHHLTPDLSRQHLNRMPNLTSPGVDEMTVGQARKNLDWILPPILKRMHQGRYEAGCIMLWKWTSGTSSEASTMDG